ncbi:tetratricopeptide repeat protein [Sorangium sp. So ce1036]|uniref:tetratricopeptide repeat protein n=1 Tax=Sorangium sp. So ce1036 TaxID=3133328 RepID=UPI003F0656BC
MTGPQKSEIDVDRLPTLLVTQARGAPLRPEDAALLRRAEEADPDLRVEAQLWAAIGALGDARGDGRELSEAALIERVLARTHGEPAPRSTARPRAAPRPLLRRGVAAAVAGVAVAATLLVALAAELMDGGDEAPPPAPGGSEALDPNGAPRVLPGPPSPAPPEEPPPGAGAAAAEPPPGAGAAAAEPPPGAGAAASEPADTAVVEARHRAPQPPRPPPEEPAMGAEALLLRAQSRLGQGKTAEALAAYRALLARHPESPEARAALVSLGQIALRQGKAAEALGHFERYLAGGGPLAAEARIGRVQCLRRLGRTADERAAIAEFLARHGDSVHAPRLRARQTELGKR